MSDKLKKQRAFNRFLGETIKGYILKTVELRNGKKGGWGNWFTKAKRYFNDIAISKYKEFMNEYKQPEEDADMNEFITNEFGQDEANRLTKLKNIDYTKPTKTEHNIRNGNEYFTDLADRIVDFITNDSSEYKAFNTNATETNALLTETYNKINNTKVNDLTGVYELIQSSTNNKRARDLRYSETHLKNELRRNERKKREELTKRDEDNKKAIEETIAEKDKEHEEEKKKIRIENDARLEKELIAEKNRTEKRMKQQQQYDANNGDDEYKDVKLIHEDYSDTDDDDGSNNKIVEYDEKDKAKNAAQQIDEKIKEDAIITRAAMDSDFYNQLDDGIKQVLRPKIEEKKAIIERSKVIRYLLPKERPKWEKATMSKGVNPLLSRGAWGI